MTSSRESSKRGPYGIGSSTNPPANFQERLRWLRKQRGLTQVELAEALGCDQTLISSWESGRTRPAAISLEALAKFHKLPSAVIDTGEGFLEMAEGVIATLSPESPASQDSITVTLDPPAGGLMAVVEANTGAHRLMDSSDGVGEILRALKKGREVWAVIR